MFSISNRWVRIVALRNNPKIVHDDGRRIFLDEKLMAPGNFGGLLCINMDRHRNREHQNAENPLHNPSPLAALGGIRFIERAEYSQNSPVGEGENYQAYHTYRQALLTRLLSFARLFPDYLPKISIYPS